MVLFVLRGKSNTGKTTTLCYMTDIFTEMAKHDSNIRLSMKVSGRKTSGHKNKSYDRYASVEYYGKIILTAVDDSFFDIMENL